MSRRYSEFRDLAKELRRLSPEVPAPPFPGKARRMLLTNKWDAVFLERRRVALELFVQASHAVRPLRVRWVSAGYPLGVRWLCPRGVR